MTKKIIFEITPEGMKIETDGYKDLTCLDELEKFRSFMKNEYGIDLPVTDQKKKPAAFIPANNQRAGSRVI
jgi:hypothetical protein